MTTHTYKSEIFLKDGHIPYSIEFEDIYYHPDQAIAESTYVFLEGSEINQKMANSFSVSIAELGFGTGLNFLLTYQAWKESGQDCLLNYTSIEGFPLTSEQLEKIYHSFPELQTYAEELLSHYPEDRRGFHHLHLADGKVKLTLVFDRVENALKELNAKFDCWYLDGFAPSRNPEMWNEKVFKEVAKLSKFDCHLSTFTSAGFVRRGLQEVGFEVTKRKGFAHKRECMSARFRLDDQAVQKPWFASPLQTVKRKKIAIIGAGIAGLTCARRLIEDGHSVKIFEKNDTVGSEGSGNILGLVQPKITRENLFNLRAYQSSIRFYEQFGPEIWAGKRGLIKAATNEKEEAEYKYIVDFNKLPDTDLVFLNKDDLSYLLGHDVKYGGFYYPKAGVIKPHALCQKLSEGLDILFNTCVDKIHEDLDLIKIYQCDKLIYECDTLICCNAIWYQQLYQNMTIEDEAVRGQVSYIENPNNISLNYPFSSEGYIIQDETGNFLVGSTFDRQEDYFKNGYRKLDDKSHKFNQSYFEEFADIKKSHVTGGRASLRAMTKDHHPLAGPMFKDEDYILEYERLKFGPRAKKFQNAPYLKNQFLLSGLGARGLQSAPILADVISSYINATVCPIENTIREFLHPARFLIRKIKRDQL